MLIVAMLTGTGILAIAIHPQLAVGGIQKLMYQKNPVNTYSPLHRPGVWHRVSEQFSGYHLSFRECQREASDAVLFSWWWFLRRK